MYAIQYEHAAMYFLFSIEPVANKYEKETKNKNINDSTPLNNLVARPDTKTSARITTKSRIDFLE